VHRRALIAHEVSLVRSLEVRVKSERLFTRVFRNGPFGPVPLEKQADLTLPVLHKGRIGWGRCRRFCGQLQLGGILHRFGDPLDRREHVPSHEPEIRNETPIAGERHTKEQSCSRGLHADERGQAFSDRNRVRAVEMHGDRTLGAKMVPRVSIRT
jgi:hypothetical protein